MKGIIVGAGIGGLSLAYRLRKKGIEVTILEASSSAGGVLKTSRQDQFLIEEGPDCFISDKPAGIRLAEEIGLKNEIIGTQEKNRRAFIVKNGKLHPIPQGFYLMAPASIGPFLASPLVSWRGKFRTLMEPFIPAPPPFEDEALASFVERRLGKEVLDRVAQPMIAGIYSADPTDLSLRATFPSFLEMEQKYGSILKGLRHRPKTRDKGTSGPRYSLFLSFKKGMSELPTVLVENLLSVLRRNTRVNSMRFLAPYQWEVETSDGRTEKANFVCMTLPAHATGKILRGTAPALSTALEQIEYGSSVTVSLAYRREQIRHPLNAMGLIVPATEKRTINSCSFSSEKFEGRAPKEFVLLRGFAGGKRDEQAYQMDDKNLGIAAERDLGTLLGISGKPIFTKIARWEKSMAQYTVGHVARVAEIERQAAAFPGLYLGGNGYTGVGVPDVIARSERIAEEILNSPALLR
ncbi:MAG: protoporphyrinogen oxidase [Pseudomonadota bacterium]